LPAVDIRGEYIVHRVGKKNAPPPKENAVTYTVYNTIQLEIWGRAQHEAARRPKSDWKYNLRG